VDQTRNRREVLEYVLNVIIVIFAGIGTYIMFKKPEAGGVLVSNGFANFKYFTVLSNAFCGIVAALRLIFGLMHKDFSVALKLMAASAVTVTLIVVGGVLAPLYPDLDMYAGSNLYFHLIVPIFAIIECVIMANEEKIPFKYTLYSAVLPLLYGNYYIGNIMVNGIGEWPDTNDWYGFLNWGWPVGIAIFVFVILLNWGVAVLLRFLNICVDRLIKRT
jgi:hypothetical protein